ncbi:MAG: CNNM domain-containing protein [Thermoanaerobaculia bacterium]
MSPQTLPPAVMLCALQELVPSPGLALTVASLKELFSPTVLTWLGIAFCLSQSAMFSGLNLGFFSVGRLRLEAEAESGNKAARRVLHLREDANFLLCTILWGNVSVNVLLALLSDSVMAGVSAFAFSTVGITLFGEIFPQAYFSRHGIRVGALLAPVVRFYQVVLFLVAKPTAIILDAWVGPEGPTFLRERDMEIVLQRHIREADSEIGTTEGQGALNFLNLDDRIIAEEGVEIAPETVFSFPAKLDLPFIPGPDEPGGKEFVDAIEEIHLKWAVITDETDQPRLVLETDRYLREVLSGNSTVDVYRYCHRPIVVTEWEATLDGVLDQFVVEAEHAGDRVVDRDVIVFWTDTSRRIVTGADILGRLLQGIARRATPRPGTADKSANSEPGAATPR